MAKPIPTNANFTKEAQRRADILDRYAGIRQATRDDDVAFAAELGLSLDSLARLATIWRRHRDERLLLGRTAAIRTVGASDSQIFRNYVDMTGVPETKRRQTLQRIRLIQHYLRATNARAADMEAAAAEAGLSAERFATLVRIWKLHADPAEMPGGSRRVAPHRKDPARTRMIATLRRIVSEAFPNEPVGVIYERYIESCSLDGNTPLSLPRVYALVREFRLEAAAEAAP